MIRARFSQRIRRVDPGFTPRDYGHATLRDFVEALGVFETGHDGRDLTVQLRGRAVPAPGAMLAPGPAAPTHTRGPSGRIAPELWSAFTRTTGLPAYLDHEALAAGDVRVVSGPVPATDGRYIAIPSSDPAAQLDAFRSWIAEQRDLPSNIVDEINRSVAQPRGIQRAVALLRTVGRDRDAVNARVEGTRRALRSWLEANGIAWGPPLIGVPKAAPPDRAPFRGPRTRGDEGDLRALLRDAIPFLSDDDLRQLRLPLGVVVDLLRR